MEIAWKASERSKDPSTQVGAVIINDRDVVSTGYNGFPPGFPDDPDIWDDRARKYDTVIHAEINAVARAARKGRSTNNSSLFVTHLPCLNCAKALIAAGITTVYYNRIVESMSINDIEKTRNLMMASGLLLTQIK